MYLHLGQNVLVRTRKVIGIFDLDSTTLARGSRDYLAKAERAGQVVYAGQELPKSFIVTDENGQQIILSQLNTPTIKNRLKNRNK